VAVLSVLGKNCGQETNRGAAGKEHHIGALAEKKYGGITTLGLGVRTGQGSSTEFRNRFLYILALQFNMRHIKNVMLVDQ